MYGFIITTAGMDMLARAVLGEPITITGVQVGKGVVSNMEIARSLTALISPVANGTSNTPKVSKTKISMVVEYRNDGLTEAFDLYEFGIFAKISNQQPTLLYYATLGNAPHKVQPISAGLDVHRFPVTIEITDDVVVTLGYPAGAFLTEDEKGSPGGVAELDSTGKVPAAQMPGYTVISGPSAMGQTCPGGPLKLENIQGNTVLSGTPAYDAPVSMESVEGPLDLRIAEKNLIPAFALNYVQEGATTSGVTITYDGSAFRLSGTNTSSSNIFFNFITDKGDKTLNLPAGTYAFSLCSGSALKDGVTVTLSNRAEAGNVVLGYYTQSKMSNVFTLQEDANSIFAYVRVDAGAEADGVVIIPQIELGSEATSYEGPSTVAVDIPLLGTDGQTLEPLRMAYTGTASIPKTAHYDRISRKDGIWRIERHIKLIDLTEATWYKSSTYFIVGNSWVSIKDADLSYYPFCTHFAERGGAAGSLTSNGVWTNGQIYIGNDVLPNGSETTVSEMQEFCAAQAEAGTPVLMCYVLAEPVYEELHQEVQALLNTLSVPGGVCSVWFEGDVLPSAADIGLPRGDYPSAGLEGAYRWLEELSHPLPVPTGSDLYAWALEQQRGGTFATSGSVTTQNVPETGDLTGILSVTEQGSAVSMLVFGPTGKLHTASRIAGVWRGWTTLYSSLSKPTPAEIGAIPTTQKGAASGVATLDSGKKIPVEQIPNLEYDSAGSASKVQTALTQHTSNKNNPHGVTAAQVGAAATSHKHSTSDITGGTLPVSRGGTGVSSLTGTDYGTYRVRGIAISDTIPSSISNGQICLVY